MIVGLGIDLVEISRVRKGLERFGSSYAAKILHPEELALLPAGDGPVPRARAAAHLAARIAAKEAGVKALGTGFSGGIGLHDLRVRSLPGGQPLLELFGCARARAGELGAHRVLLSLTHARETAAAVVVLENEAERRPRRSPT